jgi:hypothetical protein
MQDNTVAFVTGILLTLLVVLVFWFLYTLSPTTRHDVGWNHTICVWTGTPTTSTAHCATGSEFASWAKEKGR